MRLQLLSTTAAFILSSERCIAQSVNDTTQNTSTIDTWLTIDSPTLPPAPAPEQPSSTPTTTTSTVSYTPEQCNSWKATALAADTSNSGGLTQDEYFTFLQSITDPPHVGQFFASFESFDDLPFSAKIVNKVITCGCTTLPGYDPTTCCTGGGSNTELPLAGFNSTNDDSLSEEELAYQTGYCEVMANLVSRVPTGPTVAPTVSAAPSTATASPTSSSVPSLSPTKVTFPTVIPPATEEPPATEGKLTRGAFIGIIVAIFLGILFGIFMIVYFGREGYERSNESVVVDEEGDGGGEDADLVPVPVVEEEEDVEDGKGGEQQDEEKEDDASSASSVWSESGDKDDNNAMNVEENDEEQNVTEGSAVAAIGVASTVVTQMSSPKRN